MLEKLSSLVVVHVCKITLVFSKRVLLCSTQILS